MSYKIKCTKIFCYDSIVSKSHTQLLNNGFPHSHTISNNAIMLLPLAGVMIEDPTETVFDFVEFPLFEDDIVGEVNSQSSSSSSNSQQNSADSSNDVSGSLDSVYVYYSPNSRERCKWFVRRVVASRVLLGLAIVFIGLAVIICGLGMIKKDSNRSVKERKVSENSYRV